MLFQLGVVQQQIGPACFGNADALHIGAGHIPLIAFPLAEGNSVAPDKGVVKMEFFQHFLRQRPGKHPVTVAVFAANQNHVVFGSGPLQNQGAVGDDAHRAGQQPIRHRRDAGAAVQKYALTVPHQCCRSLCCGIGEPVGSDIIKSVESCGIGEPAGSNIIRSVESCGIVGSAGFNGNRSAGIC